MQYQLTSRSGPAFKLFKGIGSLPDGCCASVDATSNDVSGSPRLTLDQCGKLPVAEEPALDGSKCAGMLCSVPACACSVLLGARAARLGSVPCNAGVGVGMADIAVCSGSLVCSKMVQHSSGKLCAVSGAPAYLTPLGGTNASQAMSLSKLAAKPWYTSSYVAAVGGVAVKSTSTFQASIAGPPCPAVKIMDIRSTSCALSSAWMCCSWLSIQSCTPGCVTANTVIP